MPSQEKDSRESLANCLAMVLEGKVSLDHLFQEHAGETDPGVRAALEEVGRLSERSDRFASPAILTQHARERLERLVAAIRGG